MIRLSANLSRKVPIAGVQFSSQQYGAALEIEVSDADKPEVIQTRIREMYNLLSRTIDEQIDVATQGQGNGNGSHEDPPPNRAPRIPTSGGNGSGRLSRGNRTVMATSAQLKAIRAICADRGLQIGEVLADWNGDPERLTVKEASSVIDALKGKPAGNGIRR